MFFITTEIRDIPVGELSAHDIACPLCQKGGGVRFAFHQKEYWNTAYKIRTAGVAGNASCAACASPIAARRWSEPMHHFYRDNKQKYSGKFSIKPSPPLLWVLGLLAALLSGAALYSKWDHRYGDQYAINSETIRQAVEKPTPGSILMVDMGHMVVKGNTTLAVNDYTLMLIEKVEGNKITARLHKTRSADPLTPYRNAIRGESDNDFSQERIVLTRHPSQYQFGFDRILPNGEVAPLEPNQAMAFRVVRVNKGP
jgi:hypothetical protein